ncbi:PPK2 family polyphosphate kinase [Lactobacillaceae bacterium 24-114]
MKFEYTGKDFLIKKAPTFLKSSEGEVDEIKEKIGKNLKRLRRAQKKIYARHKYGILVIFQAMDAAGKDSMIAHVFSGVDPVGFKVANFKQPTSTELRHDYLWRVNKELPSRGEIGIFNRSYYEDVLVTRVHPELILNSNLPGINTIEDVDSEFFDVRYKDIKHYEEYLTHNGFVIVKFFLHLSKEEQKKRFLRRINLPKKHWKFSAADIRERQYWDGYQKAYEEAIRSTATKENPWYVIPADDKWYSRLIVSDILTEKIEQLSLAYPQLLPKDREELMLAKRKLENEN